MESGALPAGAYSVQVVTSNYSASNENSGGSLVVSATNNFSSPVVVTSSNTSQVTELATSVAKNNPAYNVAQELVTVYVFDQSGNQISATSFTFSVSASGNQ